MRLVRWILILPGAVLAGMIGSLGGGILAIPFGQFAMDTSSAFFGTLAFVCAAGVIAPARRSKTALIAASFVSLLALFRFTLSIFTTVQPFAGLSTGEKILIPIAQLLGSLYAVFIVPPLVAKGSTLEDLWREIVALGTTVVMFGALVIVLGLVFGLLGRGWIGFRIGFGVLGLGALTWCFPFVHVRLRLGRAKALMERHLEAQAKRNRDT